MSLLRFDQTVSDWVIFAPSRARRPHELRSRDGEVAPTPESYEANCPFCPRMSRRVTTIVLCTTTSCRPWRLILRT